MARVCAVRVAQHGHCPSTLLSAPVALSATRPAASRSALYVGAGLDVRPLRLLPDVQRFVMVDCKPFGMLAAHPAFLPRLHESMHRAGFRSMSSSSTPALLAHLHGSSGIHRFRNAEGRVVEYHYNTCIVGDEDMQCLLPRCDTLIVGEHDPHASAVIRACVAHGIRFVSVAAHTCAAGEEGTQTTIARLDRDEDFRRRFDSFALVDEKERLVQRSTWQEFRACLDEPPCAHAR